MWGSLPCRYDVRKPLVCCRTFSRRTGIWLGFRFRNPGKAHQRGRFSGFIRPEGPHRQMQDFERWVRGELQRRNKKFYQSEGIADFRERTRRSIWPSKLGLSSYRILPARGILSFIGELSLALCVYDDWRRVIFCRESSLLATFLNAAFVGDLPS